jgi:hypothetical protein
MLSKRKLMKRKDLVQLPMTFCTVLFNATGKYVPVLLLQYIIILYSDLYTVVKLK